MIGRGWGGVKGGGRLVSLVGFLTFSSTTRLYRGRVPRLTSGSFTCCHTRDRAGRPRFLSQQIAWVDKNRREEVHVVRMVERRESLCVYVRVGQREDVELKWTNPEPRECFFLWSV